MTITGEVETLGHRIDGWVHDSEHPGVAEIVMSLDGQAVKTIRPFLRRARFPGILVGFRYYIRNSLLPYIHSAESISFTVRGVQLPVREVSLNLLPAKRQRPVSELLEKLSSEYVLTKKGSVILKLNKNLEWQKRTFDFYDHARSRLNELTGYDLHATSGTLLGYTRERGFIGSDDDFDTSYLSKQTKVRRVRKEMMGIMKTLRAAGEKIEVSTKRRNFFIWRSSTSKAVLDVFPSWLYKDMYYHAFAIGGPHAHIFSQGLKEVELMGRTILVPKADEEACAAIYGPAWRTPDPLYQWATPPAIRKVMDRLRMSKKKTAAFRMAGGLTALESGAEDEADVETVIAPGAAGPTISDLEEKPTYATLIHPEDDSDEEDDLEEGQGEDDDDEEEADADDGDDGDDDNDEGKGTSGDLVVAAQSHSGVRGEIQSLGRQVRGWVFDPGSSDPVAVTLAVEGHPIRTIRPAAIRADLSKTVPTGFLYYITKSLRPYIHAPDAISFSANGVALPVLKNEMVIYAKARQRPLEELQEKLASGYFFTKKGKLILELNKDLEWQKRIFDFYDHARTVFKKIAGYDLFATAGTLLGYSRERGFIGSDDDFDTCYISKHTGPVAARNEMLAIMTALRNAGEDVVFAERRNFFYWRSKTSDASLDVFPAWIKSDMFYHTFAIGGPYADIFTQGVKEVELMGRKILVPNADEDACAAIYGPSWRTPDPLFQWVVNPLVTKAMHRMRINKRRVRAFEAQFVSAGTKNEESDSTD